MIKDPQNQLLDEIARNRQFQATDKFRQNYADELEQNKDDFEDQKKAEHNAKERMRTVPQTQLASPLDPGIVMPPRDNFTASLQPKQATVSRGFEDQY